MGSIRVLVCDVCEHIDSPENRVVRIAVCGPYFELCRKHRVEILGLLGVPEGDAGEYCDRIDDQGKHRGARPSLAGIAKERSLREEKTEPTLDDEFPATGELDEIEYTVQDEKEASPKKKRG